MERMNDQNHAASANKNKGELVVLATKNTKASRFRRQVSLRFVDFLTNAITAGMNAANDMMTTRDSCQLFIAMAIP